MSGFSNVCIMETSTSGTTSRSCGVSRRCAGQRQLVLAQFLYVLRLSGGISLKGISRGGF